MRASVPSLGRLPQHRRVGSAGLFQWLLALEYAFRVHRERQKLMQLDPHLLKDIGITQDQVHRETSRSFGDLPKNRPDAEW